MKRRRVGDEIVESMREALGIARGEIEPTKVHTIALPLPVDVREVRKQTGLSRAAFAQKFALDPRTVRDWEHGPRMPDRAARAYLRVTAKRPDAVIEKHWRNSISAKIESHYSTVTDLARFLGWSTSQPLLTAMW